MDVHVPKAFIEVTKCFTLDSLEDGRLLIGLCTTSGQLLEFVDRKVIDSCDIGRDGEEISTFTSYNPVQKYYLIRCGKVLVVVKRNNPLCVIKTYEDVIQVQIQDRLRLGRPQVVIWTLTDKEPTVTDFVSQLHSTGPQAVPHLTTSLNGKLQELNLRVEKAHRLLQERKSVRAKTLYQLTPHLQPPEDEIRSENKVLMWGPPFQTQEHASHPPLQLSQPWCCAHNGKWIIGIPVFNATTVAVEDVALRLQMDSQPELRYETHVISFPQRISTGAEWTEPRKSGDLFQRQSNLAGTSAAVIVGVLGEPLFKKSSVISISGAIIYRKSGSCAGEVIQDLLRSVQFKVEDLVQGILTPFSAQRAPYDERDVISVALTSNHWQLNVSSRHHLSTPLLLSDHGLEQVPSIGCWVGHQQGSLAGLLVIDRQISSSQYMVELYAKDLKQALQFVHSLCTQWEVEERSGGAVSLADCVKTLAAELRLLLTRVHTGDFAPGHWSEIREQLNQLELATDLSFLSYSSS